MKKLHLGNVNFEWELKTRSRLPFEEAFLVHPNFLQLQFLPLLYKEKEEDEVLVSHFPKHPHARLRLLSESNFSSSMLESWGWSETAKRWAKEKKIAYAPPSFTILREITSKVFSFTHSSILPGAQLLHNIEETEKWLASPLYPKVLKTCFGLAGQGIFLLTHSRDFLRFRSRIVKNFEEEYPLIGEPWVERLLDFSTQWTLFQESNPIYLGTTIMKNNTNGQYERTIAGEEKALFGPYFSFFKEHLEKIQVLLNLVKKERYFGPLGIDAMVYRHPYSNKILLHPVVELNVRKTMGWLALKLLKKKEAPFLSLSYISKPGPGLLPHEIFLKNGQKISFRKQLKADILDHYGSI